MKTLSRLQLARDTEKWRHYSRVFLNDNVYHLRTEASVAIAANIAIACKTTFPGGPEACHGESCQDDSPDSVADYGSPDMCPTTAQNWGGEKETGMNVEDEVEMIRMDILGIETAMAFWRGKAPKPHTMFIFFQAGRGKPACLHLCTNHQSSRLAFSSAMWDL
jgi:hypothetical protein